MLRTNGQNNEPPTTLDTVINSKWSININVKDEYITFRRKLRRKS